MKVVIAPDSFKESLTALQVCQCIKQGFASVYPNADYHFMPLADGGEGTVDVLMHALNGERIESFVEGPLGESVMASWALLDKGQTALIEVAAASGLDLLPPASRDPLLASTYGTGQIIKQALEMGVSKIVIGLGGSATNDAGAGIIQALGGRLVDQQGEEVTRGGLALKDVASIDLSAVDKRCASVKLVIACDVSNPLTGETGASYIFGPQKGASEQDVKALDSALDVFAVVAEKQTNSAFKTREGFGAAGGTPLGLSLLFNAELKSGIEMVLDTLNANQVLQGADLVITGEGQMDDQTLQGKTPYGIAKRAVALGIPVIGIAGSLGRESQQLESYFDGVFGTVRAPQSLDKVLAEASTNLERTARNIAATLKLGSRLPI